MMDQLTEEALIQERHRVIGVMSRTLTHQFNNVLSSLSGYSSLLKTTLGEEKTSQTQYLEHVMRSTKVATFMVQELMNWAGPFPVSRRAYEVQALVDEACEKIEGLDRTNLKCDIDPQCPPLFGDHLLLQEMLVQLLKNAWEASDGQAVEIKAQRCHLKAEDFKDHMNSQAIKPGEFLQLTITDHGHGMSEEDKLQAFNPRFSTRHPARGLGLAAILQICCFHYGAMTLQSELGKGTTTEVIVPVMLHE